MATYRIWSSSTGKLRGYDDEATRNEDGVKVVKKVCEWFDGGELLNVFNIQLVRVAININYFDIIQIVRKHKDNKLFKDKARRGVEVGSFTRKDLNLLRRHPLVEELTRYLYAVLIDEEFNKRLYSRIYEEYCYSYPECANSVFSKDLGAFCILTITEQDSNFPRENVNTRVHHLPCNSFSILKGVKTLLVAMESMCTKSALDDEDWTLETSDVVSVDDIEDDLIEVYKAGGYQTKLFGFKPSDVPNFDEVFGELVGYFDGYLSVEG